jgi:hypothetical protein
MAQRFRPGRITDKVDMRAGGAYGCRTTEVVDEWSPSMRDESVTQDELVAACAALVEAALAERRVEAGRPVESGTDDDAERSLATADALSRARDNLYKLLIEDGWQPPAKVVEGLTLDEVLSHEDTGFRKG